MFFSLPTETFTNDNKDFNGLYKFYTPDLKMKTIRMETVKYYVSI